MPGGRTNRVVFVILGLYYELKTQNVEVDKLVGRQCRQVGTFCVFKQTRKQASNGSEQIDKQSVCLSEQMMMKKKNKKKEGFGSCSSVTYYTCSVY